MRASQPADFAPNLSHQSEVPLYRQLYEHIALRIRSGELARGERLPATRELAGLLGLNRTTVSAAYDVLETEGLIAGQVGRGSFVTGAAAPAPGGVDWIALLDRGDVSPSGPTGGFGHEAASFVMSRPSRALFPLDDFRASCEAVLSRPDLGAILQLGSPSGYEPLRRHLMDEARRQSLARSGDDLIITNGCQQALDLIGRVLLRPGDTVAVEDPVYTGQKNLLTGMGAQLVGIPVGGGWIPLTWNGFWSANARVSWWWLRTSRIRPGPRSRWRRGARCSMRPARRAFRWWKTTPTAICDTRASPCPPSNNWTSTAARCCCAVSPK
jgi:hypothetical protein